MQNCFSNLHISGDKKLPKFQQIFQINKISLEKRVPWKVAKESYLKIAKNGHQNTLIFENKTRQPETNRIVPKTETLSPDKLLNLIVNVHKLAQENTKTQEEKIKVIKCLIDDTYF